MLIEIQKSDILETNVYKKLGSDYQVITLL